MENIILIAELLLYFLYIYIILKNLYGYFPKNKKTILNITIFHCIFAAIAFFKTDFYILIFGILLFSNIISLKATFKDCKIKTILLSYITIYSINSVVSYIFTFLFNQLLIDASIQIIGFIVNSVILIGCIIVCQNKSKDLQPAFRLIPLSIKRTSLISIIASAFAIGIILDYGTSNSIAEWDTSVRILLVLLIVVIGSIFPMLIANSIGKSFYNKQAKIFEEQIEIQSRHYEEQAKNNFELRRFKHDYKNMLIAVQKLIRDGDTDSALKLLQKESDFISSKNTVTTFDTGNGIVDAILTEKQKKANTSNSIISFEGAIPTEKIAPTDLCVIFGNILDNAIEACEKIESDTENMISVVCRAVEDYIFVNISNPVREDAQFDTQNIKTSKKDKINHGFGLYSLKKSLKKYNGNVSFNCDNQIFSVDLELNMPA